MKHQMRKVLGLLMIGWICGVTMTVGCCGCERKIEGEV